MPTTYTDAQMLEYVRAAIVEVVAAGQSYVTGLGQSVTKADLGRLRELETLYTLRVNRTAGRSRAGIRFGGP